VRYAIVHPTFTVHGGTEVLLAHLTNELVRRGHEVTLFSSGTEDSPALAGLDPRVDVVDLRTGTLFFDRLSLRDWSRVGTRLAPALCGFDVLAFQGLPSPMWWQAALKADPGLRKSASLWFCHGLVGWLYDDVAGARTRKALVELGRGADRRGVALALARIDLIRERGLKWTLQKLSRVARVGLGDARPDFIVAEREAVRSFTSVFANSEFTARNVREIFGVEANVCYPGLESDAIPAGFAPPGPDLLTVARLQFSKNHRRILRAVAEIKRRGPVPFRRYVIVGDGPESADLRSFADELGIGELVEFAGTVTGTDLDGYYDRAGLFVLPAFDEGFGLVYLEAAARGRASIASSHGGPAEIVADGETGWVVDPFDPMEIADAILKAFDNPAELARRGAAARARLLSEFTVACFVDRFEEIARAAIAKASA